MQLLSARWLLRQSEHPSTRLLPWARCPKEAFLPVATIRRLYEDAADNATGPRPPASLHGGHKLAPVIAVSHCWNMATNSIFGCAPASEPDSRGLTLQRLGDALRQWLPVYERFGYEDMGVFIDFCCLPEPMPRSSAPQATAEAVALDARHLEHVGLWHVHALTTVYALTDTYSNERSYWERGFTTFEWHLAWLVKLSDEWNIWPQVVQVQTLGLRWRPIRPGLQWVKVSAVRPEARVDTTSAVREVAMDLLPAVSFDTSLRDAGLGSLGTTDLRNRLLSKLGGACNLPETLVFDFPTLRHLEAHLSKRVRPQPAREIYCQPLRDALLDAARTSVPSDEIVDFLPNQLSEWRVCADLQQSDFVRSDGEREHGEKALDSDSGRARPTEKARPVFYQPAPLGTPLRGCAALEDAIRRRYASRAARDTQWHSCLCCTPNRQVASWPEEEDVELALEELEHLGVRELRPDHVVAVSMHGHGEPFTCYFKPVSPPRRERPPPLLPDAFEQGREPASEEHATKSLRGRCRHRLQRLLGRGFFARAADQRLVARRFREIVEDVFTFQRALDYTGQGWSDASMAQLASVLSCEVVRDYDPFLSPRAGRSRSMLLKAASLKDGLTADESAHVKTKLATEPVACVTDGWQEHGDSEASVATALDVQMLRWRPLFCQLVELSLNGNPMTSLPDDAFVALRGTLETLGLRQCTQLSRLPDSLVELRELRWLRLDGCSALKHLPARVGVHSRGLSALGTVDLRGCSSLSQLPEGLGRLPSLTALHLEGSAIGVLPPSVERRLVSTCRRLHALPSFQLLVCDAALTSAASHGILKARSMAAGPMPLLRGIPPEGAAAPSGHALDRVFNSITSDHNARCWRRDWSGWLRVRLGNHQGQSFHWRWVCACERAIEMWGHEPRGSAPPPLATYMLQPSPETAGAHLWRKWTVARVEVDLSNEEPAAAITLTRHCPADPRCHLQRVILSMRTPKGAERRTGAASLLERQQHLEGCVHFLTQHCEHADIRRILASAGSAGAEASR